VKDEHIPQLLPLTAFIILVIDYLRYQPIDRQPIIDAKIFHN
jgi:hypothetical protein